MKAMMRSRALTGVALAAALALALPVMSPAQVKNSDDIKYPVLPEFNVPTPQRVVLDNGLVVILIEDHELPLVNASVRVHTGGRLVPADKLGLASLTGAVMRTGGTTTMSPDELDDYLEGKAATVETSIGNNFGSGSMSCLSQDLPDILGVFADVLRNPVFAEDRIDMERKQITAGIARQNDNPQGILFREFQEVIYGEESPYARNATYTTVANITRNDLVAWHGTYFHPNQMILGLVGDFDSEQALAQIKETFGAWTKGPAVEKVEVAYNTTPKPGVFYVEKTDMTQSNIIMGHLGIQKDNPDYYPVEVMNQVLSGSFASRLFSNVRSKKGLAYAVSGSVGSSYDHEGLYMMFMTTKTETTGAGIEALLEEARNMTALPPTDEEVAKSKAGILNSFVFNSDSGRKILNQQITYEYYGYPLDWLARYRDGIDKVTTAQVREAAAKYIHTAQLSILVVGPTEGQDKPLDTYGPVALVDITIPEMESTEFTVTAENQAQGATLLAGMLAGTGGAERVDSVESLSQKGEAVATTPQGEMAIKLSGISAFPDRMRQDVVLPFGTLVTVITPDDSFRDTPQGVQPLPDSQKEDTLKGMRRDPVFLLKARGEEGLVVASMGPEEFGGTTAEMLHVEYMGDTMALAIDPESGLCIGMRFQGKDFTGAPGEMVQVYSDFRDVDGLQVPFKTVSTYNGDPFLSSTLSEVSVNGPITDETFARPSDQTADSGGS
jgi:zinc protease